ncbi:MAG: hypothetical protein GC188_03500 [Alphaproteobacteria bacterium]|nr:hypothetical protein [Alphaproteobacteria bacterium]
MVGLAALSATQSGQQYHTADHYEQSSRHTGENPAGAIQSATSDIYARETHENNPQSEIDRPERFWWFGDTVAQWIMAAGTIATVGLVTWTVLVTRKMLKEAEDTARAARDAVDVTRDIGQKQVRAYLEIESVVLLEPDDLVGTATNLKVTIRNTGQSRASEIIATYCMKPITGGDNIEGRIHFQAIGAGRSRTEETLISNKKLLDSVKLKGTDSRVSTLYVHASYKDVFSDQDVADFAAIVLYSWEEVNFVHEMHPFAQATEGSINAATTRHWQIVERIEKELRAEREKYTK